MTQPTLPSHLVAEFDKELPADRVIVKHVGTIHGIKIISEEVQQVEAIDREKAKQWFAQTLETEVKKAVAADRLERDPEFRKTLVAIPEGYKYVEVTSLGKVITRAIKDIPNGSTIKEMYLDEAINPQESL